MSKQKIKLEYFLIGLLALSNGIYGLITGRVIPNILETDLFLYKSESTGEFYIVVAISILLGLYLTYRSLLFVGGNKDWTERDKKYGKEYDEIEKIEWGNTSIVKILQTTLVAIIVFPLVIFILSKYFF